MWISLHTTPDHVWILTCLRLSFSNHVWIYSPRIFIDFAARPHVVCGFNHFRFMCGFLSIPLFSDEFLRGWHGVERFFVDYGNAVKTMTNLHPQLVPGSTFYPICRGTYTSLKTWLPQVQIVFPFHILACVSVTASRRFLRFNKILACVRVTASPNLALVCCLFVPKES